MMSRLKSNRELKGSGICGDMRFCTCRGKRSSSMSPAALSSTQSQLQAHVSCASLVAPQCGSLMHRVDALSRPEKQFFNAFRTSPAYMKAAYKSDCPYGRLPHTLQECSLATCRAPAFCLMQLLSKELGAILPESFISLVDEGLKKILCSSSDQRSFRFKAVRAFFQGL